MVIGLGSAAWAALDFESSTSSSWRGRFGFPARQMSWPASSSPFPSPSERREVLRICWQSAAVELPTQSNAQSTVPVPSRPTMSLTVCRISSGERNLSTQASAPSDCRYEKLEGEAMQRTLMLLADRWASCRAYRPVIAPPPKMRSQRVRPQPLADEEEVCAALLVTRRAVGRTSSPSRSRLAGFSASFAFLSRPPPTSGARSMPKNQ